jgi:hypothetical protein
VAGYQAETNQDTAAVYRDYWPVTNIGQKFAAVCYSFRGFGRETELMVKNSEVVDVDVPKLKTGSGIPDCSVQINTCTIDKYVGVLASNYQLSDTTFTQDGGSPAVFQKGAGGITVKYKGWCGPVEGATWSSGTATITSAGHPLTTGDIITVTGVDPGEYNVSNVPVTATTTDTISYAMVDDPGSYVSGGSVSAPNVVYCIENPTNCCYTSQSLTCCTLPSRPFTFPSNLVLTITNQTGFVVNLPTTTSFFPWTYFPGTGYGVQWLTTIPQILGTDADGVYGIIVSLNIFCEAGIVYLVIQIYEPRGGSCATAFTAVGPNYTLGLPPYLGTPGLPVTIIHRVFDCDGKWDPGTGAGELLATFESGCASNTTFDLRIRR